MRLATGCLSKEEFGLWSFTTQSVGYFLLLDFGVSNSLSRLFGEPFASGNQKSINSWFTLSVGVLALQGLLILAVGALLRNWVLEWFNIPNELRPQASQLWMAFLIIQAVNFPLRVSSSILYAQNRAYLSNLSPFLTSWVSLGCFYWMLKSGLGVMAYIWSTTAGVSLSGIAGICAVTAGPHRFRFSLTGVTLKQIKELFSYSFSIFAVSIAVQIALSSQALIITKLLGLAAGAMYNVTSRMPLLAMQMIWRPFDAFGPRWLTAHCESRDNKIAFEFGIMSRVSFMISAVVAIGLILINPIFVTGWAKVEYFGGHELNILLSLFIMMQTLNHCYSFAFSLHKKMKIYIRVVCVSSAVAVCFMIMGVKWFGLPGIPAGLLATDLLLGVWFYVIKGGSLLGVKAGRVVLLDIAIAFVPICIAFLISNSSRQVFPANLWIQFVLASAIAVTIATPLLWKLWTMLAVLRKIREHTK